MCIINKQALHLLYKFCYKTFAQLTVGEACDPSESGDRNMRHIPIHAEEGQGARVDAQVAQCRCSLIHLYIFCFKRKKRT